MIVSKCAAVCLSGGSNNRTETILRSSNRGNISRLATVKMETKNIQEKIQNFKDAVLGYNFNDPEVILALKAISVKNENISDLEELIKVSERGNLTSDLFFFRT